MNEDVFNDGSGGWELNTRRAWCAQCGPGTRLSIMAHVVDATGALFGGHMLRGGAQVSKGQNYRALPVMPVPRLQKFFAWYL